MGLPKCLNFFKSIMKKEESQNASLIFEELVLNEQGKARVDAEDESEVKPGKRGFRTKASESKSKKRLKSGSTGLKSLKNELASEMKQSESNSNARQIPQQDSQQDSHRSPLYDENHNTNTESQTQPAMISDPEDQNDHHIKEKMDFLDLIGAPRTIGEYATFWRTSPFQHTSYFITCVNELEKTEQQLKESLVKVAKCKGEEKRENRMTRNHSALAKTARLGHQAIASQGHADLKKVENISQLLEQTIREEFMKEL